MLRRRPERDPAPIIIGGTIAFLALVIVIVFLLSSVFGGGDGGPDGDTVEVAPGISARLAAMPSLPPGLVAVSDYFEFEAEDDVPALFGLPLKEQVTDPSGLGFYTFLAGRWQRLGDVALQQDGRLAEGDFPSVPRNLAVLRVVSQTYQVAASIPSGASLHIDARVNILSPRDFTPLNDGAVQGSATEVDSEGGFLLMPTIVGSGQDTAAIVNDIIASESLAAQHIQEISSLVQSGGFDGIDLEYPSVSPDLRDRFTSFVRALADDLHAQNKRLSLTLPPPTGQRQAYDWKALGESVDIIKVLPVADPVAYWKIMPEAFNRIVQDVDPKKVMLVLSPFSVEGLGEIARPIGYLQAMVLAAEAVVREPQNPDDIKPGVTVRLVARNLDEGEGASPLRWSDDSATVTFTMGGTERRQIFIENSFSFNFKLELVQTYGLGGVAVADGSAESDVANVWSAVNQLLAAGTVTLVRPNESTLLPIWQAPDGGDLGAGAGTSATWIAPEAGQYNIILAVSDGERRFGRRTVIEVQPGEEPSPTPVVTFPPETETPTPTPEETETPTPTGPTVAVQVGKLADGDDDDSVFSNDEITSPGSAVVYLITIDNDSDVPVTIESLADTLYPDAVCTPEVTGIVLAPDDGDGPEFDVNGDDTIQCTITVTAPEDFTDPIVNEAIVIVSDEAGTVATDNDDATVRPPPSE